MSITVRLWTTEDLKAANHDKWLATLLMNAKTLTKEMAEFYPYQQRRTYIAEWQDGGPVTIYATDEKMLLKFIDLEYTHRPDWLSQKITQYRPIEI